jgi:hypothetical protein
MSHNSIRMFARLTVVTLVGLIVTYIQYCSIDKQNREEFIKKAKLISVSINPEHVMALDGSEQDLQNEFYKKLKNN